MSTDSREGWSLDELRMTLPHALFSHIKFLTYQSGISGFQAVSVGASDSKFKKRYDRFLLKVPFCGISLTWQIIYSQIGLPDVIFDTRDPTFFPDLKNVDSYMQFNLDEENALAKLVAEFLLLLRHHHLQRAESTTNARLASEMSKLKELLPQWQRQTMQVYLEPNPTPVGALTAHFRFPLDLDFQEPGDCKTEPFEILVSLALHRHSGPASKIETSVVIPKKAQKAMTGYKVQEVGFVSAFIERAVE
eukprot:Colp12_sorted_trinity150504_noHs@18941